MEVVVDTAAGTVSLSGPSDFARFSVRVVGDEAQGRWGEVLAAAGVGRDGGSGHAWVSPEALRGLAADVADAAWGEGFDAMVRYAASKGWVGEDGWLRAHVVRDEGPGGVRGV